jgi:hypothetical protein
VERVGLTPHILEFTPNRKFFYYSIKVEIKTSKEVTVTPFIDFRKTGKNSGLFRQTK